MPRAKAHHLQMRGSAGFARRAREIAALPSKLWKGKTVFLVTCRGDYGKGNHEVWIPERILWLLVSIDVYRCPYHQ